jgi:hypothetical protein
MAFNSKKWDDIVKEYEEEERLEQILKTSGGPHMVNPKDIGVTFGKPMTEEEFLEHRKNNPGQAPPHILKAEQKSKSEPINIISPKKKLQEKLDAMARERRSGSHLKGI